MKRWLLIVFLMANSASAAKLENVTVLEVNTGKDGGVKVKLHADSGPDGSYFFVDIVKSDSGSFDKLALVAKKLQKGAKFKLGLDIKSFSMSPSGSYYRSGDVAFFGADSGD